MSTTTTGEVVATHYSTKELARLYGVCDKTLLKWMKPFADSIGPKRGRYYTRAQVTTIFDKLGKPSIIA